MDELEKVIYINKLLQIYGELLTDIQKGIMSDYYEANLSMSEIAEDRKISKAAVEDAIKKATEKLQKYEKSLQILSKKEEVIELVKKINEQNKDEIIEEIERRL